MPEEMVAKFVNDHRKWCFRKNGRGWEEIAVYMARNFKVSRLSAAVRLSRLGYIRDVSDAGCRVRSIRGWDYSAFSQG